MRYISLFSGIEAASVAWEPLGWEPVAFSEIEPFPCAVLAERFPDVPNLGDVNDIDWSDYVGAVDLIVGGSPCQAFSVAGRRRGLMDERGRLMLQYVRAVREVRPRWLLWENVPGVLSQSDGDAFATLHRELAECGYSLAWRVLDAQFAGVAQRRRRVFLVGHSDPGRAAAVLFERESLRWDSPSSKAKRQELARSAGRGPRCGCGAGTAWAVDGNVCDRDAKQNGSGVSEGVAPTLNTVDRHAVVHDGCLNPWDPQSKRVFGTGGAYQTLYAHGSGGHDDGAVLVFDESQVTSPGNRSKPGFGRPCHTLTTDGRAPVSVIAFSAGQSRASGSVGAQEDVAPTLRAGSSGTNQVPTVCVKSSFEHPPAPPAWRWPWIVRRLMPVECERLQGFPDDWTRIPYRGKPADECPDTPRYKALGNSMAVPVMRWIGRRIQFVDGIEQ